MIPVFEPEIGEAEALAAADAVRAGEISGSFGRLIPDFERQFAEYCGAKHAVAVTSGTAALHLAVHAAGIGAGDEVLVSASTNIASALCIYHNGAVPIPIDSEDETWNLDLDLIRQQVTPRTKAIIPVHLFGHPIDLDRLRALASEFNLVVIEDCAEAHGALCRGNMVGRFSDMACYSFYANKIITTGEGGMITTDSDDLAEKLRLLRNLGFTKPRFRHDVAGYNFRMTGMQAAIGIVQLRKIEDVISAKRRLASAYASALGGIREIQLPGEMDWARHVYWMYAIRVRKESRITRDALAAALREDGIDTRTFFCPMNRQPCFENLPRCSGVDCPVAEQMWTDGLYLPSSTSLQMEQVEFIARAIARYVQ